MASKISKERKESIEKLRRDVWAYYRAHGRHDLAWRKTTDPYRILVSEIMLQQTQVARVEVKYAEFLKTFRTVRALSRASLSDVLRVWSGMGYNRRAKFLREGAIDIVQKFKGKIPQEVGDLRAIRGIGPYTASAVRVFAFNMPDALIETNIRAVYIHHFFSGEALTLSDSGGKDRSVVSDEQIIPLAHEAAMGQDPRQWHWALMDYGTHIKKLYGNPARRSNQFAKQSTFEGSLRQVRGAILRELHEGPSGLKEIPFEKERIERAVAALTKEGMIEKKRGKWQVT